MSVGYSPYAHRKKKGGSAIKLPQLPTSVKKWLAIIGGVILAILIGLYLALGDLRFFANHLLGFGFFHKNYLIVLQNNYEARPGGGFITGYGEMSVTMGVPGSISFHNSYEIDTETYVTPPFPHEKFLKNEWYEGYTFRDANWEPDFPQSASTLIEFYQRKFPEKNVDGIVVVNFSVIEDLVGELGGLAVDGQELNRDNLFAFLTHEVNNVDRHDEEALMERKDIMGELAQKLMPKAKWNPIKTRRVIEKALAEKEIYLWSAKPRLQGKLESKGWANHLELPPNSDFIHVNIANLGSKKADRYLRKEVHHYVNMTKEVPEVKTEIVVRYPGFKNNYADDYKGFLRLYVPGQAEIRENLLDSTVREEGDFKVIEEEVILPAGSKTSLSFTYSLPRSLLNENEYRLRVAKQSGDEKHYDIIVETFQDSTTSSADFSARENRAFFNETLGSDRDFVLKILPDKLPPYPIEQVFSNLKTISVYWNEPMGVATGNDATNYVITDLNQTDPNVTDEPRVVYAEIIDGSVSKLEVEGISDQPLERYRIEMKNLRDASGNPTEPDPKEVTVVQRFVKTQNPVEEAAEEAFVLP